jgi:DNA-binding response OmpR family regulator
MYKILIGDNNSKWLDFSKKVLESHGYNVVTALTVDSLRNLLAQNNHDLVLINATFMFGEFQDTIRTLFLQNADKPIIIVSVPSLTHTTLQETRTAFKMGAKDYVDKPFSSDQLLTLVKQLLEQFVGDKIKHQGVAP